MNQVSGTLGTPEVLVEERKSAPIKWWAAIGVIFLLVEAYTLVAWITSDKFVPTPKGDTPVPTWMVVSARANEILAVVLLIAFFFIFVVRPLRRTGRLNLDGMLFLAFLLVTWQDPGINYAQVWATYNTELFNYGSWLGDMPGSLWPNANMFAEPIIWVWFGYAVASFGFVMIVNVIMRKTKARWPQIGFAGLMTVTFVASTLVFFIAENLWLRMGLYTYAGSISGWTLFEGHHYQYPVYEAFLGGLVFCVWASLRYFVNDRGETFAERGVDHIQAGSKVKGGLRFLAICGLIQAAMMFTYNVPHAWFALHAGDWPKDITDRSYFTNGICGPDTPYACPGPGTPVPRRESAFLTNDGHLGVPTGTASSDGG